MTSRFLVDENLPRELAAQLSEAGHDAEHVYSAGLRGALDEELFRYAQEHARVVLTSDIGFGNALRCPELHAGGWGTESAPSTGTGCRLLPDSTT
jgi:hypothetical protein